MENLELIICIIFGTTLLVIIIRLYLNKPKERTLYHELLKKDDQVPLPRSEDTAAEEEKENISLGWKITELLEKGFGLNEEEEEEIDQDLFEEQEKLRYIPDEDIERVQDQSEKEWERVNNFLIKSETKTISSRELYDLKENFYLTDEHEFCSLFTMDSLIQVAENKFIALLSLQEAEKGENQQTMRSAKRLMGIVRCHSDMGTGYIDRKGDSEKDPYFVRLGHKDFLYHEPSDQPFLRSFSEAVRYFRHDHTVFVRGKTIYIRIDRMPFLDDSENLLLILKNFPY
jgi:hypothetical protein